MSYPASVRIVEVGPRDGLQNESLPVSVETRTRLIDALSDSGLRAIEAGSFVSPQWVPRMAGTAEVLAAIRRQPGVSYSVLVPNMQGMAPAEASHVGEVAVFAAASESFSQANVNASIDESLARFAPVAARARSLGMRLRGYVSCVLGCPYEGEVGLDAVARVAVALRGMGCGEISLGDTIGVGTPLAARRMFERVAREVPAEALALHFHDTYGQALANILACLECGAAIIDSAVSGLGGCPYARGATGNVATEDVVYMLDGMGIHTGVSLDRLIEAGTLISTALGRETASRVARASTSGAALV